HRRGAPLRPLISSRPRPPPGPPLFPYTTLFRSSRSASTSWNAASAAAAAGSRAARRRSGCGCAGSRGWGRDERCTDHPRGTCPRSEEHTSELQSRRELVCRLLLEKKKQGRHELG